MFENSKLIKKVVKKNGGKVIEINREREVFEVSYGKKKFLLTRKFGIGKNFLSHGALTKYKDITALLLQRSKLETPKTIIVSKNDDLRLVGRKIQKFKLPLVVKNASGSNSRGVFVNIQAYSEANKILNKEIGKYGRMVVQEMVEGNEYRILILNGKVIAALQMIPPYIIGNGKDNTISLMEKKQEKTKKGTAKDKYLEIILSEQGETFSSVPSRGKTVYFKKNSSLDEGGETLDVTDCVHPSFARICKNAAEAVMLDLAGIDIICKDVSQDAKKQDCSIIEINGKPDIYIHYYPTKGAQRDVALEIINYIIKNKKY